MSVTKTLASAVARAAHLVVGESGEARGRTFLAAQGLEIIEANFRTRFGEIDLIAQDADTLVFVEVRVRREGATSGRFGGAAASITPAKQAKIAAAAGEYLARYRTPPRCRFDVLAMNATTEVQWIKAAFSV